jgi:hypothetical protein
MKIETSGIAKVFLYSFAIWFILRRTDIGQAYSSDMAAIPQQLGVAEGLKSAIQFVK